MVNPDGAVTAVVSGLTFPTGMTMGPDGALYVATFPPGAGEVVRIALDDGHGHGHDDGDRDR
jgi:sugar lactone lactonase YvrE